MPKLKYEHLMGNIESFKAAQSSMGIELEGFLKGEIFNGCYSFEEQDQIVNDLGYLLNQYFPSSTYEEDKNNNQNMLSTSYTSIFNEQKKRPVFLSTAGAPGTGKSHYIEHLDHGLEQFVYVDPDRVCLPAIQAYHTLNQTDSERAYQKFRDASNFMANFMLIRAVSERKHIVYGTTASSDRVKTIYQHLRGAQYVIDIRVLFADQKLRLGAINHRNQNHVQVSEADVFGKEAPILERLFDAYVPYADQVILMLNHGDYWKGQGTLENIIKVQTRLGLFDTDSAYEKFLEVCNISYEVEEQFTRLRLDVTSNASTSIDNQL